MHWPKIGAIHFYALLELLYKGHAIKEFVVYLVTLLNTWAIECNTLQFKHRVGSRWRGEDLHLKQHKAPKRSSNLKYDGYLNRAHS